jgi:hypothetical protein
MLGIESLLDARFLLQLLILAATVVLSVWRTNTRLSHRVAVIEADQERIGTEIAKEIHRLADQIEKQNGYVRTHGEELAALRTRIAVEESLTEASLRREKERGPS